jgi:hypothetical protein
MVSPFRYKKERKRWDAESEAKAGDRLEAKRNTDGRPDCDD